MLRWLAIWVLLFLLAGLEIGRVLGRGNPTSSEPEPVAGVAEFPQHTTAALIREVLARGRADGLDTRQLAGAVTVVLESHGLLQREVAT